LWLAEFSAGCFAPLKIQNHCAKNFSLLPPQAAVEIFASHDAAKLRAVVSYDKKIKQFRFAGGTEWTKV